MKLALIIPGNQTIILPTEIQHTLPPLSTYGLGFVGVAVGILYLLASILAFVFLIYGGIKWISSEGDAKKIEGARTMIFYAIIGLSIVFFSYLIINVISNFIGVSLLHPLESFPGPCPPGKPC